MRLASVVDRARTHWALRNPPPCPAGWRVAPPDFIGLGAQRCGTTWLYSLIAAHPDVHAGGIKELHFFHRFWDRGFTDADAHTYARYFPRPPGCIAGEWSPGYLSHFWVPPLVRRAAPDARLLVSLRDPVERYRSGIVLQAETRRPGAASASAAFRLGCYGLQLEHLLTYTPRDQLLVLQLEAATADPGGTLHRIYEHVGLEPGFRPLDLTRPRNVARARKADLDPDLRRALVDAYEPDVRRLLALDLGIDVTRWPHFAHLA